MVDEYIRKADAVNIAESYEVKRDGFHLNDYEYGRNQVADSIASDLEDMPPADVVPICQTGCKGCKRENNLVVGSCGLCARFYKDMYEGMNNG